MKNKIYLLFVIMLCSISTFGQNVDIFNGYKCIYVPPLEYEGGVFDIYDIATTAIGIFQDKGFVVITDVSEIKNFGKDIQNDPCTILTCQITHPTPNAYSNSVTLSFFNCKNQLVYKTKAAGGLGIDLSGDFRIAVRKALSGFRGLKYSYNSTLTPITEFPKVESTDETEETIKTYLSSNKIDPIEGIYKSYQTESLSYYKVGIIKMEDKFKAIIIESESKQWKVGEVKAVFEQSSMKGFYSVKWFMGNKTSYETFANMDNAALLVIEFKDQATGEKRQDKFIKIYPSVSSDVTVKKDDSKSSGSGFFLTTGGIVATNAHVVADASNIEITVSNDVGTFTFKAKVLLADSKNDVALLQIDDDKFKGLTSIPYGITENSEVGSTVFTIGYPLNDIMGTNFKVSNGIISSKTGIEDDVRYYQISVPLQPGNSGGPLFNMEGNIIGITSSKLNSKAVGTQVENVNYAIKSSYLLNLYNMLPNASKLSSNSQVSSKELQDQVKILKNYVCLIRIF